MEQQVARELGHRVLATFVLLCRPQEFAHELISDCKFAQVFYVLCMFDVPELIDVCAFSAGEVTVPVLVMLETRMKPAITRVLDSLAGVASLQVERAGEVSVPGLVMLETRMEPATMAGKLKFFEEEVVSFTAKV